MQRLRTPPSRYRKRWARTRVGPVHAGCRAERVEAIAEDMLKGLAWQAASEQFIDGEDEIRRPLPDPSVDIRTAAAPSATREAVIEPAQSGHCARPAKQESTAGSKGSSRTSIRMPLPKEASLLLRVEPWWPVAHALRPCRRGADFTHSKNLNEQMRIPQVGEKLQSCAAPCDPRVGSGRVG